MKTYLLPLFTLCMIVNAEGQTVIQRDASSISLSAPSVSRGASIMEALAKRRSIRVFSSRNLNAQDLSDLLWAANGINRPDSGKRTAPSALNRQDIQVYACLATGCYRYDEKHHALNSVSKEDVRPAGTPVYLVLVADEDKPYAGLDAGMVSQNISLFCAGTGLATYPRAQMDTERLKRALKLNSTQRLMLSHPVGYAERVTQN